MLIGLLYNCGIFMFIIIMCYNACFVIVLVGQWQCMSCHLQLKKPFCSRCRTFALTCVVCNVAVKGTQIAPYYNVPYRLFYRLLESLSWVWSWRPHPPPNGMVLQSQSLCLRVWLSVSRGQWMDLMTNTDFYQYCVILFIILYHNTQLDQLDI